MSKHKLILSAAICALAIAAVVATYWSLSRPEPPRSINVDRAQFPIKGIDISAHNGNIDFTALTADSIAFIYIKATEGTSFRDSLFIHNYTQAKQAGIPVGAYHFFRFDCSGKLQARNLISTLKTLPRPDLPVAIDLEEWGNPDYADTQAIVHETLAMVNELNRHGYRVIIYTNKKGYRRFVHSYFTKLPLWICSFTNPPIQPSDNPTDTHSHQPNTPDDTHQNTQPHTPTWTLWQHSHQGTVKGINGPVDINTFNGTLPQFHTWLHSYNP